MRRHVPLRIGLGLKGLILLIVYLNIPQRIFLQQERAFNEFRVEDCPNDGGDSFCIIWRRFDNEKGENRYRVYWVKNEKENIVLQEFRDTDNLKTGLKMYYGKHPSDSQYHGVLIKHLPGLDEGGIRPNTKAKFFVEYVSREGVIARSPVVEAISKVNWFATTYIYILLFLLIFTVVLLYYIERGKRGKEIFIRKMAGLDAIDDAIGRATEMGKPILYVFGLNGVSSLSTIASLSIFGQVIKKLAQYGTRILVPCFDPIVMTVAKEVAKNSYLQAGRPDLYREDDIFFVTDDQFGYVTSVNGLMVKQKTATNLFLGYFMAEALLLSETGVINKSIQIAGTDAVTQLPFFVVTCDYTLIGEELYAAGAYVSKEPLLLSTLKVQDIFKIVIFAVILFESIFNSVGLELLKYIFFTS
ncbi:MAG: DUF6754 domain-containing protein [Planctomycetota bacterium]